ncbi:unnamed protein product [Sphagnum balticum]
MDGLSNFKPSKDSCREYGVLYGYDPELLYKDKVYRQDFYLKHWKCRDLLRDSFLHDRSGHTDIRIQPFQQVGTGEGADLQRRSGQIRSRHVRGAADHTYPSILNILLKMILSSGGVFKYSGGNQAVTSAEAVAASLD